MAVKPFSEEELNFFKFASIVHDEFPKMLRSTFVKLWDSKIAPLPGYQVWDDTPAVRALLLNLEGGLTAIPTNESLENWDCAALFKATIYSKTFAISTTTTVKTLSDQFLREKKTYSFDASQTLASPTGNPDETITLAIDQVRRLRNRLCHSSKCSITKRDFDNWVQLAKDAFIAVEFPTNQIDYIGSSNQSDIATDGIDELRRKLIPSKLEYLFDIKNRASWTDYSAIWQEIREPAKLVRLPPNESSVGGSILFEIKAKIVPDVKDMGVDTVNQGEFFHACERTRPSLFQDVLKRGFGDERDDQEMFSEIKQGCLQVPLHCLTDERFQEVLDDFQSGRLKERLLEKFSRFGNEIEGLEIEIKNNEEVKKTREDIKRKLDLRNVPKSINHAKKFQTLKNMDPGKLKKIGPPLLYFAPEKQLSLGKGSNGTLVYVGILEDDSEVAVKRLLHQATDKDELDVLRSIDTTKSPYILSYRHFLEDENFMYIILDLCEETLEEYVESHNALHLREEGPRMIEEILHGVKFLHDQKVLHRDLKPSNILVDIKGQMKLADFGLSRVLDGSDTTVNTFGRGTQGWMPAEVIEARNKGKKGRYKKKSDIQSIGMIAFFILTGGRHPFGATLLERMTNISTGYPVNLEILDDYRDAQRFVTWLISHDINSRPYAREALEHSFLHA